MLLTSVPHLTERWDPGTHAPAMAGEGTEAEDGDAPLIRLTDDHFAAIRGDT